jgi:hypothetical protein
MSNPVLEAAIGDIDGDNDTFQTSEAYTTGTVRVYHNGLLLQQSALPDEGVTELGGVDFRVVPTPLVGDTLHVYYLIGPVSPSTAYPDPPQCYQLLVLEPIAHSVDVLAPLGYSSEEIVDDDTDYPLPMWSDDLVPDGISAVDLVPIGVSTLTVESTLVEYHIHFEATSRTAAIGGSIVDTSNLTCTDFDGESFTFEAVKRDDGDKTYTIVDATGIIDPTGSYIYVNDLAWCTANTLGLSYLDLEELLYD